MSNWEARRLSGRQVTYAALDALVTGQLLRALRLWHSSPSACAGCASPIGAPVDSRHVLRYSNIYISSPPRRVTRAMHSRASSAGRAQDSGGNMLYSAQPARQLVCAGAATRAAAAHSARWTAWSSMRAARSTGRW